MLHLLTVAVYALLLRCLPAFYTAQLVPNCEKLVTSYRPGWSKSQQRKTRGLSAEVLDRYRANHVNQWIRGLIEWNVLFCFLLWFSFCFILQNATSRVTGTFPTPAGYYGDNYPKQPKLSWSMQFPQRRMSSNITSISVPWLCHCVRVKHLSCLFTLFLRRRFEKSEVPRGQIFSFPMSDLEIWKWKFVETMHHFIFSPLFLKMERNTSCIQKNRDKNNAPIKC